MDGGAISFLVRRFVFVWHHGGQFLERVHSPHAAWGKHHFAPLPLSALPIPHSGLSQRAVVHLAFFAGQMCQLPRAYFGALLSGRTADRDAVSGLLALFRTAICP